MKLTKHQKRISDQVEVILKRTPPYRVRTECETEEILHKYRVLERKKEIKLIKIDSAYPVEPSKLFHMEQMKADFLRILKEGMIKSLKELRI